MEMSLLGQEGQKKQKKDKKKISGPPEDTDYQPFDWKKIVYSKKYIRKCKAPYRWAKRRNIYFRTNNQLTNEQALWIILVLMIVATILISVFQDKVVDVGQICLVINLKELIPWRNFAPSLTKFAISRLDGWSQLRYCSFFLFPPLLETK